MNKEQEIEKRITELKKMGYGRMVVEKNSLQEKFMLEVTLSVIKETKLQAQKDILEQLTLPCCHVSGMHDPEHFDKGTGICSFQIQEAFFNLIDYLKIEELKVKSKEGCYWCNYNKEHPNEKTNHSCKEFVYNVKTKELKQKIQALNKQEAIK